MPRKALLAVVLLATCATLLLGPVALLLTVVTVGVGLVLRQRRAATSPGAADLAVALDVLAGCLSAGASMPSALSAAQVAAPVRVSDVFATAALALERGEEANATWAQACSDVPELTAVGRLCARAASTGAPVAAELHRIAAAHRTSLTTSRRRRLERAAVWLVLPLGLCFLPAFVLVGVVPLVLGVLPGAAR